MISEHCWTVACFQRGERQMAKLFFLPVLAYILLVSAACGVQLVPPWHAVSLQLKCIVHNCNLAIDSISYGPWATRLPRGYDNARILACEAACALRMTAESNRMCPPCLLSTALNKLLNWINACRSEHWTFKCNVLWVRRRKSDRSPLFKLISLNVDDSQHLLFGRKVIGPCRNSFCLFRQLF